MATMHSLFDEDPGEGEKSELDGLSYEEVVQKASTCVWCRLRESRSQVVFGEGPVPCDLLFIGEAPGEVEDRQGRPFVGPAGKKLDEILAAVGIPREQVYITNTVKCRPPDNRLPHKDEMDTCWPYLVSQIHHLRPKIIVTLGNAPTQHLLSTKKGITKVRGQFFPWRNGIEVFPMYHPSYLLRNPSRNPGSPKHLTWQDIQAIKARLDELRGA